jgi:hypothetical protein
VGEVRNAYKIFVGKPEWKRPFSTYRHRWDNIKMDLRETGWESVAWIHMTQEGTSGRTL